MTPWLSVLTPSFNSRSFIEDCLDSVTRQSDPGVEVVVADGGSTDGTLGVLQGRAEVLWDSEPDAGQSEALNKAFSRSNGSWIGWLNADEFYLPGAVATVRGAIDTNDADVIYGDYIFVDETGALLRLVPQHPFDKRVLRWYGPFLQNSAMFIRRDLIEERGWDPSLRTVMDWDLMLSLMASGARFVYLPLPLGAYRIHHDQVTAGGVPMASTERQAVRARWNIANAQPLPHVLRVIGRSVHIIAKFRTGAYSRQLRARHLRGEDMRWFRNAASESNVARLLALTDATR